VHNPASWSENVSNAPGSEKLFLANDQHSGIIELLLVVKKQSETSMFRLDEHGKGPISKELFEKREDLITTPFWRA
jgi:hypothetical protein